MANSVIPQRIGKFSFNGNVDSDGDLITNCPINSYVPSSCCTSTSRTGWIYEFHTNTNKSENYWYVNIRDASGTIGTGEFSGSFYALKN